MTTYADLRAQGIRHIERMTGREWTDFNAHDPGITLLEALCYVLTDLAYRTEHDIPDLLADRGADPYESLHAPADILTTRAVTADDLRRLVLDVVGVKNAWIEPVEERLKNDVPLRGLYRVAVEASPEREGIAVRRDVGRLLHKHRGLCEDFTDIVVLEPLKISVDAKIEIRRVDDPAITYAQILDAISEVVSPTVPFTTLDERLASGLRIDEIFDGPLLQHGFVTDAALSRARRLALHGSDIVHAIMDVPGVRAVTEVVLRAGDARDTWSLAIPPDRAARLDRLDSSIQLLNAGLPVAIGAPPPAAPPRPRVKVGPGAGITPPSARDRNVGVYHSVQHHLPMIYGVGELGLPAEAPPERRARAKQLKAYLMLFDQLMANHLAQLAHINDLFSIHAATAPERTYFTQIVDEPTLALDAIAKATHSDLDSMVEEPPERLARKHRFLNHLLARVAEDLNDRYTASGGDAPGASEKLIKQKQAFLKQYPRISGSRGTASDGLGPWSKANPSGLEERLHFKLGLVEEDGEAMAVIEHIHLRESALHRFDAFRDELLPSTRDPYSLRITFVFPGHKGRFGKKDGHEDVYPFRQIVEQTVRAQTPAHIGTHVLWLDAERWADFTEAHVEWWRARREHLASKLGISLGLDPRLGAKIAHPPRMPGIGPAANVADWGANAVVDVHASQEGGAHYSLVRESDRELYSASAEVGTGKLISITSNPLAEDLVLRVQVERLFDDTILLDAMLPVKVRANPKLAVVATGSPLFEPGSTAGITVQNSQPSVAYRAYIRALADEDFFAPEDQPALTLDVLGAANLPAPPVVRVTPPPNEAWNAPGYAAAGVASAGNGGALELPAGTLVGDSLVIVQAHKDHVVVSGGQTELVSTDVQLEQAALLLARPGPALGLALTQTGPTTVLVTGGEPGVLYYLLDPASSEPLGEPAYFHRKDEADPALNRGIGKMRVACDFVVARGPVAAGADQGTTPALDPVVTVTSLPGDRGVKVMAVRARTGAAWTEARTVVVAAAP